MCVLYAHPPVLLGLSRVTGINFVHYIEQKDCTAGLDASGTWEIPYTKVNQVYSSNTGQTVHSWGPLSKYLINGHYTGKEGTVGF